MSWKFPDNPKEYGILYAKPLFPKGNKLEWLNYAFLHIENMPKDLSQKIKEFVSYINSKYSDKIVIPLDYATQPGLVCESDVIEEIANLVYEGFNKIIKDLTGFENCYILVWSIGEMEQPEELIRQGKRISDNVPTLHNIDPYNIVVKVGHKLDSTKEPGIFKV
jgi:hypothetical protein